MSDDKTTPPPKIVTQKTSEVTRDAHGNMVVNIDCVVAKNPGEVAYNGPPLDKVDNSIARMLAAMSAASQKK